MARRLGSMGWGWLLPAVAVAATLTGDAGYVLTRGLAWWRFAQGALVVVLATGLLGLVLAARLSPPRGESAASRLDTASRVLWVASLVNFAISFGLRALFWPTSALAWLALYLAAASSALFAAAGWAAWRSRELRQGPAMRVTMAPKEERARR